MDVIPLPDATEEPAVFLVELHTASAGSREIEAMHRALRLAVTRLHATGVPIRWLSGMRVPEQSRCLYFIAAPDRGDVSEARDTAGLPNASVHAVLPVPGTPTRHLPTPVPPHRER